MEWQGGKPKGSVNERKDKGAFIVRFLSPTLYKSFYYYEEKYRDIIYKRALKFRYEESERRGKTYNKYRYVTDKNGIEYIEIKLNHLDGVQIMMCDKEDFHLVEKKVWHAHKDKKTYYVVHSENKATKNERFHRLIYPEYKEIDHIDRNGLNNRRNNLRSNIDNINYKNQSLRKDNKNDKTGVHYDKHKVAYIVQWSVDGKRHNKTFSIFKYDENAQQEAIKFRENIDKLYQIHNGYNIDEIDKLQIDDIEKEELNNIVNQEKKYIRGISYNDNIKCFDICHYHKKIRMLQYHIGIRKMGYENGLKLAEYIKTLCNEKINKNLTIDESKNIIEGLKIDFDNRKKELYKVCKN